MRTHLLRVLPLIALLSSGCTGGGGSTDRAPAIGSIPSVNGRVAVPYTATIHAVDPEAKAIAFSLQSGPAGMAVDAASGAVTWTPTASQTGANEGVAQASHWRCRW